MKKMQSATENFRTPALLICLALLWILLLTGCQKPAQEVPAAPTVPETIEPTVVVETEPPLVVPTEPAPTAPADGNPDDITCKGTYTATDNDVILAAHKTVATVGDEALNNAQLQIYYWMAVNSYREAGHEIAPDFTQPLDTQLMDYEGVTITWQQYFLMQGLNSWHSYQAMSLRSEGEQLPLEEAYGRNEKKHAENLRTKIYNLNLLYGYNTDYTIADAHQAYLNDLPDTLKALAAQQGYESASAMVTDLAGVGTNAEYLLKYAELMNTGYALATTLSYYIEPTAEEVETYFTENEAAYAEKGITKDETLVNLRHILLIPKGGEVDTNGVVTASADAWSACKSSAESLLTTWKKNPTEANFSEIAFSKSQDTGSNINGGLYSGLAKGQLTEALDTWCFDTGRKAGDTAIIKTDCGYHVLYFSGTENAWFQQAEKDLIAQLLTEEIAAAAEAYPMSVNYSAIALGHAQAAGQTILPGDVLYHDVAHERFPVAPLYFQQDYPDTMYGAYSLRTYGCGITTMAMLTSYMTDNEWTPPEMCALYGKYCSKAGTAHSMFTEVPTDRGFYTVAKVHDWSEALKAMEDGYMVVTLQRDGYWTNGGHYLLLHNLIETEDGTKIQVRDSNLYNYKRLEGHTTGHFNLSTIPPNGRSYWIYQKKVTRFDTCVRCGTPTEESSVPYAIFADDYVCPKCHTAVNRRDAYLNGCFG